MIVSKLIGGLGNQMFQYALGKHLSIIHKTDLLLDISSYKNDKFRKYSLDCFNIDSQLASKNVLLLYSKDYLIKANTALNKLMPFFFKYKIIYEENLNYNPKILRLPDNIMLVGYFQSEKYFRKISEIIRTSFTLKKTSPNLKSFINQVNRTNSIGVHIRRGDFANNQLTNSYHGVCSPDYYRQAHGIIKKSVYKPIFYIFSDEIEWVKYNLKIDSNLIYIDKKFGLTDFEEMIAISNCQHQILANSSFSWWGAWLNINKNKIVITPNKWLNDTKFSTRDLIPESWIKI